MNKHYSYENIELWKQETWEGRNSLTCPLSNWICKENTALVREQARLGIYDNRTDGVYDFKTKSVSYQDVIEEWNQKGLFIKSSEMAGICWIAMIPHAVKNGVVKNPKILVVLHEADFTDQNWLMNTIEYYRAYNEFAAKEGYMVLYVTADGVDKHSFYINILQELAVILHICLEKVWIDVSTVYKLGKTLADVEGFTYKKIDGTVVDSDACVEKVGEVIALDVTDRWQNSSSSFVGHLAAGAFGHPLFDFNEHIHSSCGKKMSDGIRFEYDYKDPKSTEFLNFWEKRGLKYESHDKNGEQWTTITPLCVYENPDRKIPVMVIFQEVTYINPYQSITAVANFYEYIDIAAEGELMLLFFALETPNDNDLLCDIIDDACNIYPIDRRRVYLTGHSHNAQFIMEFSRRHHEIIAAVAALGMSHGMPAPAYSYEVLKVTDEMIKISSKYDLPIININGYCENNMNNFEVDTPEYRNMADSVQRRLKASRCPGKSFEEIAAAKTSDDYVTRMLGIPTDETSIQVKYGRECYIGDIKNVDRKKHLRLVSIEKMIHISSPQMPELSWDFMRRFARDLETDEIIELY